MKKPQSSNPKLAADPVERIGHLTRTVSAVARLKGKNKLDQRQALAAETYRDAFETVHASLGGSMDFDRVRGSSGASRSPPEAALIASQTLRVARALMGARTTIIVEQIVCHGRTTEECTRLVYGYNEAQTPAARDINYVGRTLREALTELGRKWHPNSRASGVRAFRAPRDEVSTGEAGPRNIAGSTHVGR